MSRIWTRVSASVCSAISSSFFTKRRAANGSLSSDAKRRCPVRQGCHMIKRAVVHASTNYMQCACACHALIRQQQSAAAAKRNRCGCTGQVVALASQGHFSTPGCPSTLLHMRCRYGSSAVHFGLSPPPSIHPASEQKLMTCGQYSVLW